MASFGQICNSVVVSGIVYVDAIYQMLSTLKRQLIMWIQKASPKGIFALKVKDLFLSDDVEHLHRAVILLKRYFDVSSGVIVDVGAADGRVSKYFADHFPQCDVKSYEPDTESYKEALLRLEKVSNVEIFNLALGDSDTDLRFYRASNGVSSSFLKPVENNQFKVVSAQVLPQAMLDTALPEDVDIHLLKMDVQGFELKVLRGAEKSLSRTGLVVLELSAVAGYKDQPLYYEIDEFMRRSGFVLVDTIVSYRNRSVANEFDCLYLNRKFINSIS